MKAIETRKLTKYYGRTRGIFELDLSVEKGEIFGFIGPNGAGKSTTIRTLLGFIMPSGGKAEIFGMDIREKTVQIKKKVGYLPAEVNYYEDMRVKDLFRYVERLRNINCTKKISRLSSILKLDPDKKIINLSTGNKKKTAIIQALLHDPELLILDEPTGGLDPLMQERFFGLLQEEKKRGATVFFSSHVLSDVQKICDRVAIIKEGRVIKVEEIKNLREKTYKKIRIAMPRENNAYKDFKISGMENIRVNDNIMDFYYSGKINEIISALANTGIEDLWIDEPSLEEIFMHYYEKEQ